MADPHSPAPIPALDPEYQSPATDPIHYVSWVHFADPGWRPVDGGPGGTVTIAWALHLDGQRVERPGVEPQQHPQGGLVLPCAPDAPWWFADKGYRERLTQWTATGAAFDGTIVTFWMPGGLVEIVEEETTRLRIRIAGRDVLTPLGYPIPAPPADPRYPVQVSMFVNRFTVGPPLDSPQAWPTIE